MFFLCIEFSFDRIAKIGIWKSSMHIEKDRRRSNKQTNNKYKKFIGRHFYEKNYCPAYMRRNDPVAFRLRKQR